MTIEPELILSLGIEPAPKVLSQLLVICQDVPEIAQLVGSRNEPGVGRGRAQMSQICLLALAPGRFRNLVRVGALDNDPCHPFTEQLAYGFQRRLSALV